MKISHKLNPGWKPPVMAPDDAYDREVALTLAKAERAWRRAEHRLRRAERVVRLRPTPAAAVVVRDIRAEVLARYDELRRIQALMAAPVTGLNRSGRGSVHFEPRGDKPL